MAVMNRDVAGVFNMIGDLLDIRGANPFRVRAYRRAARTVSGLSRPVAEMVADEEDLSELPGIGDDLAGKIETIVKEGTLPQLEELKEEVPPALSEMMQLPGLGPKRVKTLHSELGIASFEELKKSAEEGRVRELDGFGEKTEKKILDSLEKREEGDGERGRILLYEAEQIAAPLLDYLEKQKKVGKVAAAGSFRRRKETVGDLDILVTCRRGCDIIEKFVNYEDVEEVVSKGESRSTVILRTGFQVDLRVVPAVGYGAALVYFTGSKPHNIRLRRIAAGRELKINEYGVFREDERVAGKTEKQVYQEIDLALIPPELREDRGEIDAAKEGSLPHLVTIDDIKGDLQSHTRATDGKASLKEMADRARDLGYQYLANTEHTRRVHVAGGLDAEGMEKQIEKIDKLNSEYDDFRVIKGAEVDILKDGSLDLPDGILERLDLVLCAVHYHTDLSAGKQTRRILKAMENPHFNILAHPTGRLINKRDPYRVEMDELLKGAVENNCFLEINAQPERLDLNEVHARKAGEMGILLSIGTDAHSVQELGYMKYGIYQARRAWLEPDGLLNTRSWKELKKLLKGES
ncbi:MAG: DNA polymerase/3'-5' exonuclease PolX [Candidatus Krumholzibacteriales bacterium]